MMLVIDFNQIARAGKLIALLGFFLPWVTVSCSGTEFMTATGLQLMTGDPQPAGPLAGMSDSRSEMEDAEPAALVIAAFAVVLLGLVGGLLTRAQTAAAAMLAAAMLGAGLTWYSVENMREEMRREISQSQSGQSAPQDTPLFSAEQQSEMSRAVASSIEVEKEEGYWLSLGALGLAALFALMTLVSRRATATGPPIGS
jgi:hypothetical protein